MYTLSLPRLGQTMEEGTLVDWLKAEGESFEAGEELYEVETEKATVAVQAARSGRLLRQVVAAGALVPVGGLIAVVAEPGEAPAAAAIAAAAASGTAAPADAPKVAVMPSARKLAGELGVDLAGIVGSGADGAITVADVRHAARPDLSIVADAPPARRIEIAGIARAMADSMAASAVIPQFTQIVLTDASSLARIVADAAGEVSVMDLVIEAVVDAARAAPAVLASYRGAEVWHFEAINLALATSTPAGLMLPVLHGAETMSRAERGLAWRALAARARAGRLAPADLAGATIALSNLGNRGIETGTPLLPPGLAAIAFFGSLEPRPMVVGGAVVARPSIYISVAFDHRIIDGVTGAGFTAGIKSAIESMAN